MGQADIQQSFSPASVDGFDQIYQSDPVLAQSASEQAQPDPVVEVETGPDQDQIDPTPKAQTDPERDRLLSIIESQAHQLKAAGDVIIYLRSQVDEKDTQLKLLTDSQHKQGWWARFSSWFTGH